MIETFEEILNSIDGKSLVNDLFVPYSRVDRYVHFSSPISFYELH